MANEVTLDVFAKDIANASPEARLALAQQLKDAKLWTGDVSSVFNIKYYGSLVKLEEAFQGQLALDKLVGATTPKGRYDVLASLVSGAGGAGGAGGADANFQRKTISSPTDAASVINAVFKDLVERKATDAEMKKYTSLLQKAQNVNPQVYTDTAGAGYTQRGGVDPTQFITQKVEATAEAKTAQATDAYAIMMEELGGLR